MRKSKELSLTDIARIRAHFCILHENPPEIAVALKIKLQEIQQVCLDNQDDWFKQRDNLSLQEKLTEIDLAEIEKTRLIHYLHNVALRKLVEFFEGCTPEQAVAMYRQIPALKDIQTVQRIMSNRPTSITNVDLKTDSQKALVELLNKDSCEADSETEVLGSDKVQADSMPTGTGTKQ